MAAFCGHSVTRQSGVCPKCKRESIRRQHRETMEFLVGDRR